MRDPIIYCEATVWRGTWDGFQCSRRAIRRVLGVDLCTQHARIAEEHERRTPGHFPYYMPQPRAAADGDS